MSNLWPAESAQVCDGQPSAEAVEEVSPVIADLGSITVRRLLPRRARRLVGPWCFLDVFGPVKQSGQKPMDVAPHPHIGLQTVTWLFSGDALHRDSLGSEARAVPGSLNLMTAGRGIAHSERAPKELLGERRRTHGLQLWAGLPKSLEEREPAFAHTPGGAIPEEGRDGARIRVLIGRAWGMESPVVPMSETLYVDIALPAGGALDIPALAAERAVYSVDNVFSLQNQTLEPHTMAVLPAGDTVRLEAEAPARVVLIGGEPLDGPRFIWWNFVASSRERITQAAARWDAHHAPKIPGETEWVPLPGSPSFLP
jgi:redox-sensitive bicupin YhaK (pirin superfamily)